MVQTTVEYHYVDIDMDVIDKHKIQMPLIIIIVTCELRYVCCLCAAEHIHMDAMNRKANSTVFEISSELNKSTLHFDDKRNYIHLYE